MRKWIAVAATLLLAGCTDTGPTYENASLTVASYNVDTIGLASLKAFVAWPPVIATGKVVAVNDHAYEVPVDPTGEGNSETDGPEIFGTISFKLESVLKGDVKPGSTLTVVFMSGKWNTRDREDGRIAYTYDYMAHLQNEDASLKTPVEQGDATFAIFATPKQKRVPVKADNLYQARSAPVDAAGRVAFTGGLPFEFPAGAAVTLDDIRAAIR